MPSLPVRWFSDARNRRWLDGYLSERFQLWPRWAHRIDSRCRWESLLRDSRWRRFWRRCCVRVNAASRWWLVGEAAASVRPGHGWPRSQRLPGLRFGGKPLRGDIRWRRLWRRAGNGLQVDSWSKRSLDREGPAQLRL